MCPNGLGLSMRSGVWYQKCIYNSWQWVEGFLRQKFSTTSSTSNRVNHGAFCNSWGSTRIWFWWDQFPIDSQQDNCNGIPLLPLFLLFLMDDANSLDGLTMIKCLICGCGGSALWLLFHEKYVLIFLHPLMSGDVCACLFFWGCWA